MAEFSTKQSKENRFSRKEEREIRETLRQTYAAEFPNPKLEGCPDKPKLRALARREAFPAVQNVAYHISHCSPCSQELTQFIRQYQSRQWFYRAAATVLIVVGIAAWASQALMRSRDTYVPQLPSNVRPAPEPKPSQPPQEPSLQESQLPAVQVVLDLRKRGISRGVDRSQDGDLFLPKGRLRSRSFYPLAATRVTMKSVFLEGGTRL